MNAQETEPKRAPKRTRTKPEPWPRKVRAEGCREAVTVYRRVRASGKVGWQVANYATGERVLESFEDEAAAIERAEDLSRAMSTRQVLAGTLSNEEAAQFIAVREKLEPLGLGLIPTVEAAAEGFRLTGSLASVLKACEEFARRHGRNLAPVLVTDAVKEFLAERKANGCAVRYLQDLQARLGKFGKAFKCQVATVTGHAIQDWLDGLKVGDKAIGTQSRVNYRRVLSAFFGFCERRGYLPRGWDELDRLAPVKVRNDGEVETYSPEELGKLLAAASDEILPALVLQSFCGLRSAEVERLAWENVNLVEGHVTVGAKASKTASRRVVPLCESARQWLATFAGSKGMIWKGGHQRFYKIQQRTAKDAGLDWRHNALRHSFISYRCAVTGDVPRTAFEAGNSPAMIHRHYRDLVTAKAAQAWFEVKPATQPANVAPMVAYAQLTEPDDAESRIRFGSRSVCATVGM